MDALRLSLLAFPVLGLTASPAAAQPVADPPVKVWLSKRHPLERGDRVRVHARTVTDGYLLVLHAEPNGRVRVLFPLDPFDDNYVRGARDIEIRGRGDREAFRVYESSGAGAVYAAFSRDPFGFDQLVLGDHWDYLLEVWRVGDDPEAELTALVQRVAVGQFDYDVARYDVVRHLAYPYPYRSFGVWAGPFYPPYVVHPSYYRPGSSFSIGFHFGPRYYPFWYRHRLAFYYAHCFDAYWYDPYYYDPFWCDPFFAYWYHPYYWPRQYPTTVYVYDGRRGDRFPTSLVDQRYTFKARDRELGETIGMRRRLPPASGGAARRPADGSVGDRRAVPGTATVVRRPRGTPTGITPDDSRPKPDGRLQPDGRRGRLNGRPPDAVRPPRRPDDAMERRPAQRPRTRELPDRRNEPAVDRPTQPPKRYTPARRFPIGGQLRPPAQPQPPKPRQIHVVPDARRAEPPRDRQVTPARQVERPTPSRPHGGIRAFGLFQSVSRAFGQAATSPRSAASPGTLPALRVTAPALRPATTRVPRAPLPTRLRSVKRRR